MRKSVLFLGSHLAAATYSIAEAATQCSDGVDNDGDGVVDLLDSDCTGESDDNETQCFSDDLASCSCDKPGRVLCYGFEDETDMITGASGHPDDTMGSGEADGARIVQPSDNFDSCEFESNPNHDGNECWRLASETRLTGDTSLQMQWRDLAISSASPDFRIPFTQDGAFTFGPGDSFEVAVAHRVSEHLLSPAVLEQPSSEQNWKVMNVARGDKWDAPTSAVSSCNSEEMVINRDSRSPSHDGGLGGPNMYHSCGTFAPVSECSDGCQIELQQTELGEPKCYYNTGQFRDSPGYCGPDGGCLAYAPEQWMVLKMRVDIADWGVASGNRARLYAFRPGIDSDWRLVEDSYACSPDDFEIHHDSSAAEGYGKVWLTGYTTSRSFVTGEGSGSIWFDHLVVSTEVIAASEFVDSGAPATPTGLQVE